MLRLRQLMLCLNTEHDTKDHFSHFLKEVKYVFVFFLHTWNTPKIRKIYHLHLVLAVFSESAETL